MRRAGSLLFPVAVLAVVVTGLGQAQQPPAPPPFQTTKVEGTDNVYIFRNGGHQAMFVVTSEGVIATDPVAYGRPTGGKTYLDEIRKITNQPVKYVIYSHHHYDHIAGGQAFKDAGAKIVSLDVLDAETLTEAGRLVWSGRTAQRFCLGSQGLEAALVACWRDAGLIPDVSAPRGPTPVERIACVSGSVSPVTASQIATARESGFATIPLDPTRAVDAQAWASEVDRATTAALSELGAGRDPLVHSAAGPDDPAVAAFKEAVVVSGAAVVGGTVGTGVVGTSTTDTEMGVGTAVVTSAAAAASAVRTPASPEHADSRMAPTPASAVIRAFRVGFHLMLPLTAPVMTCFSSLPAGVIPDGGTDSGAIPGG